MIAEPTPYDVRQFLLEEGIRFVELENRFSIICPYHDDHDASSTLYKDRLFFECFACGAKRFFKTMYKEYKHKSWEDGKELSLIKPVHKQIEYSEKRRKAVSFEDGIITPVHDNERALEYCRSRGVADSFIQAFDLSASEICKINGKVWTNRLLIPVVENGEDYSLEGRDYTRAHPRKCLYPKDAQIDTLFNVDNLDFEKPLVVVEGTMDLHKIWQHFTKNVTATFGIMITAKQQDLLRNAKSIILFIDDDDAGRKSISLFEKFMANDFKVTVVKGEDPGSSSLNQIGVALERAIPYGEFLVEDLKLFPETEKLSLLSRDRNSIIGKESIRER